MGPIFRQAFSSVDCPAEDCERLEDCAGHPFGGFQLRFAEHGKPEGLGCHEEIQRPVQNLEARAPATA